MCSIQRFYFVSEKWAKNNKKAYPKQQTGKEKNKYMYSFFFLHSNLLVLRFIYHISLESYELPNSLQHQGSFPYTELKKGLIKLQLEIHRKSSVPYHYYYLDRSKHGSSNIKI